MNARICLHYDLIQQNQNGKTNEGHARALLRKGLIWVISARIFTVFKKKSGYFLRNNRTMLIYIRNYFSL